MVVFRSIFLGFFILFINHCAHSPFGDPGNGFGDSRLSVYFNDPGTNRLTGVDKQIDNEIIQLIDQAEESVYAAFYNLGRDTIIDALLRAEERQLEVKAVGDIDEFFTSGYQKVAHSRIDFALGNSSGIQHNKFIIVDKKYVVTGTGNFTDNGFIRNNNNFLIIESTALAEHYLHEFDQMHRGLFASKKRPRGKTGQFTVNGASVEVYFSPYEGEKAMSALIDLVDNADSNVHYMIFAHTHDELASAMIRAANRGLTVKGVHDSTFVTGVSEEAPRIYSSAFDNNGNLRSNGVDARYDGNEHTRVEGNPAHGGKMHCKTLIVDAGTDHAVLATGSFNWSSNAINNNDENLMVIHDARVANYIYEQWQQAWAISNPISDKVKTVSGSLASKGDIIISEVGWAGSATDSGTIASDDDFIEIYNASSSTIDISHWVLQWGKDSRYHHYPVPDKYNRYYTTDNTIAPGAYRLFYNDTKSAYALTSGTDADEEKISGTKEFNLVNSEFKIRLYDKSMNLIDEAGNGTVAPAGYGDASSGTVASMQRRAYTGTPIDGSSVAAWFTATTLCNTGNNSNCTGFSAKTYGTPNYANEAETAAIPLIAEFTATDTLKVLFNSQMTNCVTNTDLSLTVESGADTITVSSISTTTDPGALLVKFSATTSAAGNVYSLTPQAACLDYASLAADSSKKIIFSGYNSSLADVSLTEIGMKQSGGDGTDYIEIYVKSAGSVRGLEVYEYNYDGKNLLYKFSELYVSAGDRIRVNLKRPLTELSYSEDRAYNSTAVGGYSDSARGTPYCIYSSDDGLDGTDDIVILQYSDTDVRDVVYYSDQDGAVAESLMKGGLLYLYENLQSKWPLSEEPVDEFNDLNIQKQGVNISTIDGSDKGITRTNGAGSWSVDTNLATNNCVL